MTDIQQARDVLAKWRDTSQPRLVMARVMAQALDTASDARLIVGTAGNPASLDADDALLALAIEYGDLPSGKGSRFIALAKRKAAAIIAADEAMSK